MAPWLSLALRTWLEAEATAREVERRLAAAIARLEWDEVAHLSRHLAEQRLFCSEMLLTTLDLMDSNRHRK